MAYFSALGGTGGTSATITVTYSEDFYGLTITATNGTTTLTKTATSSGTLTFDVSEGGTWVVSGTVEGATYSEQVDVFFEYTVPPLVALPNGSTALPVNDIQMWLKCAGIRDKSYTTLSQVLADTETFIALCADSNACDYMARSTNWASGVADDSTAMLIVGKYNYCASKLLSNSTWASAIGNSTYFESVLNVKVPTMTSNTTPSGEAFADSVLASTSYYAYKCFSNVPDGTNDCWQSSVYSNGYVGYDFGYPVKLSKVKFAPYMAPNQDSRVNHYKIQGTSVANPSESDWVDLTETLIAPNTRESTYRATTQEIIINTSPTYSKYRAYVIDSNSYEIGIVSLQFYGRTDNANYIPLVPKMTSNTTPSGECYGSSVESPKDYYYAFSTDSSKKWNPTVGSTNQYVAYDFGTAVVVNKARLKLAQTLFVGSTTSVSLKFVIQGSDSKTSDFTTLGSVTKTITVADANSYIDIEFDNSIAYRYLRLFTDDTAYWINNSYQISINELQFYKAITGTLIHSAVEDNIFYMDDGSPVALCGIPVGDTIDVDMEAFKGQTLTLVSTVAKDPTNLSNDFSMNVRITPNITEIYLMPLKSLYWYGSIDSNCEVCSTSNGWVSGVTYNTPTLNKNDAVLSNGSGGTYPRCAIGTKHQVTMTKMLNISKAVSGSTVSMGTPYDVNVKESTLANSQVANTATSYTLVQGSISISDYLVVKVEGANLQGTVCALWYE